MTTVPGSRHPDEIETAAYLDGTLRAEARDRVEAHLAVCGDCRAGVSLLVSDDPGVAEPPPREMLARAIAGTTRPERSFAWLPGSAAAAAAILILAAIGLWIRSSPPSARAPVVRGEPGVLMALAPVSGAVVESSRISFLWSPVDGADRYVVSVEDASGLPVKEFTSRRAGEPVAWPAAAPGLPPGRYLWTVRALAMDRAIAETRPIAFEVE